MILTTKSFIFRGFTPLEWDSRNDWKVDNSRNNFLFTVKNPGNSNGQKFAISNPSYVIYCHSSYGSCFENGHDIYVVSNCNVNTSSYINLGIIYVNNTGIAGKQIFTGE
jgi:hypothetical protein